MEQVSPYHNDWMSVIPKSVRQLCNPGAETTLCQSLVDGPKASWNMKPYDSVQSPYGSTPGHISLTSGVYENVGPASMLGVCRKRQRK
jgi:hypothetical protein